MSNISASWWLVLISSLHIIVINNWEGQSKVQVPFIHLCHLGGGSDCLGIKI